VLKDQPAASSLRERQAFGVDHDDGNVASERRHGGGGIPCGHRQQESRSANHRERVRTALDRVNTLAAGHGGAHRPLLDTPQRAAPRLKPRSHPQHTQSHTHTHAHPHTHTLTHTRIPAHPHTHTPAQPAHPRIHTSPRHHTRAKLARPSAGSIVLLPVVVLRRARNLRARKRAEQRLGCRGNMARRSDLSHAACRRHQLAPGAASPALLRRHYSSEPERLPTPPHQHCNPDDFEYLCGLISWQR